MLPENDSLGKLHDALIEHWDDGETIYSSAAEWPEEYDDVIVDLGPPRGHDEAWDDVPYELTQEDWKYLLDLEERLEYEANCNMRFAP